MAEREMADPEEEEKHDQEMRHKDEDHLRNMQTQAEQSSLRARIQQMMAASKAKANAMQEGVKIGSDMMQAITRSRGQ